MSAEKKSQTVYERFDELVRLYRDAGVPEEMLKDPSSLPQFSLTCWSCDIGTQVQSIFAAIKAGWDDLRYDEGLSWNFVGECPECKQEAHRR